MGQLRSWSEGDAEPSDRPPVRDSEGRLWVYELLGRNGTGGWWSPTDPALSSWDELFKHDVTLHELRSASRTRKGMQ